jgi:glycosyltransferase involved in cell wall biosynthesis
MTLRAAQLALAPVEPAGEPRTVYVLIPAYNEARALPSVLAGLRRLHPELPVVVIDDGSSDGTGDIAARMGATVLRHPFNLGYGAALQTGYRYALRQGARGVLQLDADGQHPPEELHRLLDALYDDDADLVLGSRFSGRGDYRPSLPRLAGILFFRRLVRLVTGQRIADPTSGFQALNQRCLELYRQESYPEDYPDAEVLVRLHLEGLTIREVPVRMEASSRPGKLHRGLQPVYYMYKSLLAIACLVAGRGRAT